MFDYINDYFVPVTCWSDHILPLLTLFFSNWYNGKYAILIKYMLLFSQGCLDLDVSRHITTIEEKLKKYFPDEHIATDKTSIFDCVAECFTKKNYFIYYVSLIIIVVIWIPFHESSVRIVIYIIVMWTPFNKTSVIIVIYSIVLWTPFNKSSVRIVIYIIVMWIPFNKTSVRIVKSIIVLWTRFHETSVGMVMSRRVWRYQRGNQNPYIKEDQTIQWPKGKVQKTNYDLQNIHIKLKLE